MKSYTYDAVETEYYSSSSYNPESLHNCRNTSLDSTTGGPVIIEKLDNGTNIVWNCVSPDSSLTSSNSKDKTVNTETGQNNQISNETREHENTPQLDKSVNGLENPCAIISDPHTAKNDGALVEFSAKHTDANDDEELNSIENLEHEAIQVVVKEEIVKIGAIRIHSDVKPEETEINACDDENERVDDEVITETQSEILADDENTIDKANTVKITKSDDANEVTNVIGDIVQSDDGTQSDVDEVFEVKEIVDNNTVESSGSGTERPGETIDEENNTVELTVCIDLPNADKMLSSEDFINDNIAYSKKMDSVVNMDNNNIYSNNARDLDSDLNEARVFLPRRRSSSTQQLSRNDLREKREGDLECGLEKKAFRSPLSSVDQLIEILASQTEREKSPEKTESESSDTQSDLEKSTAENKCEDSCENLTVEIKSFGAPENPPEKVVKTENNGETSLGSPQEFVKPENCEFIDSLYQPPCLKDGEDKSDEHKVCPELQDSNSNEIESNDKNPKEAKSELSQVFETETEENLLQSLNQLHDSIKIFTNSLKEKGKFKTLENRCDEGEEISSTIKSSGGDQQNETEANNVAEVKEQRENEFIDSLYELTSLKDSLYEQGNLKDEQQIEVQKEQKKGSPVKYIPQMVSQPVFFDSNYEEVTESKSENEADQSDVIVVPSCGGFFLSDVEQSETMYTQSPDGTQGPSGGERGEITYTWAEYPNRAPRAFRNSSHVAVSDKTNRYLASNVSDPPNSENTFELTASGGNPERSPSLDDSRVNPIGTLEAANNVKRGTTRVDGERFEGRENSSNLHNLSSDSLEDITLIEPLDKSLDIIETSSVRSDISQDSLCDDDVNNNNDNDENVEGNDLKCFPDKVSLVIVKTNLKDMILNNHLTKVSKSHCYAVQKGQSDMNETLSSFTDDSIEMEEVVEGATSSQLSSTLFETDTTPTFPKQPSFQWPVDNTKTDNNTFNSSDSKSQNSMSSAHGKVDSIVEQYGAITGTKLQVENSGGDTFDFDRMKESLRQESFYLNNNSGSGPQHSDPRLVPGTLVQRGPLAVEQECDSDSLSSDSLSDDDDYGDLSEGEIQILTEYGDKSLKVPPRGGDHLESIEEEGQGQLLQGRRGRKGQKRSMSRHQKRSGSQICDGAALSLGYEEDATAL